METDPLTATVKNSVSDLYFVVSLSHSLPLSPYLSLSLSLPHSLLFLLSLFRLSLLPERLLPERLLPQLITPFVFPSASIFLTTPSQYGKIPLHLAVSFGQVKVVRALLKRNSSTVNEPTSVSLFPLHVFLFLLFSSLPLPLLTSLTLSLNPSLSFPFHLFRQGILLFIVAGKLSTVPA